VRRWEWRGTSTAGNAKAGSIEVVFVRDLDGNAFEVKA